jgi:hypothetical protein
MFDDDEDLETENQTAIDHRRRRQPSAPPPMRTRKTAPRHKPYSPQFSERATVSVRRLSWALGLKMTTAVDYMVQSMPALFQPAAVCGYCQDQSKCPLCAFNQPSAAEKSAPAV